MQSTWDAGTSGYTLFEAWCKSFKEKSGGELDIKPFPAKSVAADNNALFEAVKTGVLQGMNAFTLYWAGKIPASVFLSSYPVGPDQPAQWDIMFDALGMKELARKIYGKHGLFYIGHVQHDANIIHSKKPVNSVADFKGMKLRVPGGMVAEVFQSFGASTVSLPGSDIFPALEKGTIDAAEWCCPKPDSVFGFQKVLKHYYLQGLHQVTVNADLYVNGDFYDSLTDLEKKALEVAANASLSKSMSYRIYENGKALKDLTDNHGVILEDTPADYFTEYMAAAKK